jgi:drug/metabolite transporter superfamily protein YnfA
MVGERVLKVVLVVAGLLFVAGVYPFVVFFSKDPGVPMIMSIYVTLGIFLLLAARDPTAHRSLIVFAGWANIAHASVMAVQVSQQMIGRTELAGVLIFATVGIGLVALTPSKRSRERVTAAA